MKIKMIINSKFHDYYDTAIGYGGIDKSIIYNRKTEEIEFKKLSNYTLYPERKITKDYTYDFSAYIINFVGKIYPCICTEITYVWNLFKQNNEDKKYFFYSIDKYINFLKKNNIKLKEKYFWSNISIFNKKGIKNFFDKNNWNFLSDFNLKYKVPVLVYDTRSKIFLNPCLKDYEFAKVIDPFTAFQEIQMYISNFLLNPEKEIPPMSDKVMSDCKGFDKWSFKKLSIKKRK